MHALVPSNVIVYGIIYIYALIIICYSITCISILMFIYRCVSITIMFMHTRSGSRSFVLSDSDIYIKSWIGVVSPVEWELFAFTMYHTDQIDKE